MLLLCVLARLVCCQRLCRNCLGWCGNCWAGEILILVHHPAVALSWSWNWKQSYIEPMRTWRKCRGTLTPKRRSWREEQTRSWSSPARYGRPTDGNRLIDILMGDQHNDRLNSVVFNLVIPGLWWCARFENFHTEVAKRQILLGETQYYWVNMCPVCTVQHSRDLNVLWYVS